MTKSIKIKELRLEINVHDEDYAVFNKRVLELKQFNRLMRKHLRITQEYLAEDLGYCRYWINKYEKGKCSAVAERQLGKQIFTFLWERYMLSLLKKT